MALQRSFREAFEVCPVCGGELVEKRVEKLLRGGDATAILEVEAMVCQWCGGRLYGEETVRRFEWIRADLHRGSTEGLEPVGKAYRAF